MKISYELVFFLEDKALQAKALKSYSSCAEGSVPSSSLGGATKNEDQLRTGLFSLC